MFEFRQTPSVSPFVGELPEFPAKPPRLSVVPALAEPLSSPLHREEGGPEDVGAAERSDSAALTSAAEACDRVLEAREHIDLRVTMPIVIKLPGPLRAESIAEPRRSDILQAAARAVLALCCDESMALAHADRFDTWICDRPRTAPRVARGHAQWRRVSKLPGVTTVVGGAKVRALVPGAVSDWPDPLTRLDARDKPALACDFVAPPLTEPVLIWLSTDRSIPGLTAITTVCRAAMAARDGLDPAEQRAWDAAGHPLAVRTAEPQRWADLQAGVAEAAARLTARPPGGEPRSVAYVEVHRDRLPLSQTTTYLFRQTAN